MMWSTVLSLPYQLVYLTLVIKWRDSVWQIVNCRNELAPKLHNFIDILVNFILKFDIASFAFFACLGGEHVHVWLSYCMIGDRLESKTDRQVELIEDQEKKIAKWLHFQTFLRFNSFFFFEIFWRKWIFFWRISAISKCFLNTSYFAARCTFCIFYQKDFFEGAKYNIFYWYIYIYI